MADLSESKNELHQHLQGGRWQSVLNFFETSVYKDNSSLFPFKAQALLRLDRIAEAFEILKKLLPDYPHNGWIINLYSEALEKLQNNEAVADFLKKHIEEYDISHEALITRCADLLRIHSRYSEAVAMNQRRLVFKDSVQKIGLAIQTFNKKDTLEGLFESLLKCNDAEHFAPVILQDSWKGSKREEEFKNGAHEVKNIIHQFLPRLIEKFGNIEIIENQQNMGTAPSCVKLINHVAEKYDSFVFFEDDCVLYKDTLSWTKFALTELIDEFGSHFASCESVFFDHGRKPAPTQEQLEKLKVAAGRLINKYCRLKFVPSTNFMTTSKIWKRYSDLRCLPRGPESLNQYYASVSGTCIFPLVARTSDIGMEHELGFSTTALGKGNVKEIKNSYVNSDMFNSVASYEENLEHQDLIYSATSNMVDEHIDKLSQIFNTEM